MHYIAIAQYPKDARVMGDLAGRRKTYRYPSGFTNVQAYLDVHGGRSVVHFETDDAAAILQYTAAWPEVVFDIFPVVPSETGWGAYLVRKGELTPPAPR